MQKCSHLNSCLVLSGLSSKSKANLPTKDIAREALKQVKAAYGTTELKILDAMGSDITKAHFDGSKTAGPPACDDDSDMNNTNDQQQDLLGVTRSATELSLERHGVSIGSKDGNIRPAILLTEDKGTRIRAKGERLAALAPSVLRKYLENGVTRLRSLSRGSQGKPDLGTTTPPPVLSPTGIKDLDSAAPDQIMENGL